MHDCILSLVPDAASLPEAAYIILVYILGKLEQLVLQPVVAQLLEESKLSVHVQLIFTSFHMHTCWTSFALRLEYEAAAIQFVCRLYYSRVSSPVQSHDVGCDVASSSRSF